MTNGNGNDANVSLGEAATLFLTGVKPEDKKVSQQAINRFVRWYGAEKPLGGLSGPEIASYAEQLSCSDTDYGRKLELVRAFLARAKKEGWSQTNLGVHLKIKKRPGQIQGRRSQPEAICFTPEGYAELKTELAGLKGQRHEVIAEMTRAAADKDFRENAPLQAARERRGHLEGRIKELEETLKLATVIAGNDKITLKAGIGDHVVLNDMTSGKEHRYMIVNPKETDPVKGKISSASPIGKAIVGRHEGEVIEIQAPVGKLSYRIMRVER